MQKRIGLLLLGIMAGSGIAQASDDYPRGDRERYEEEYHEHYEHHEPGREHHQYREQARDYRDGDHRDADRQQRAAPSRD